MRFATLSHVRQYPPWLLSIPWVPKVQPAEDTQTMTHARSTISLVVRVISRSKNNFYDVIRLKIIESRYFPKETASIKGSLGAIYSQKSSSYFQMLMIGSEDFVIMKYNTTQN